MKPLRIGSLIISLCLPGIAASQVGPRGELARQIAAIVAGDPADVMRSSFDAVAQLPNAKAVGDAVTAFYAKYLPRDSVVSITARAYARTFDEPDLRSILAWITTPVGNRFIAGQAGIAKQAREQMALILNPHQDELRQIIQSVLQRPPEQP